MAAPAPIYDDEKTAEARIRALEKVARGNTIGSDAEIAARNENPDNPGGGVAEAKDLVKGEKNAAEDTKSATPENQIDQDFRFTGGKRQAKTNGSWLKRQRGIAVLSGGVFSSIFAIWVAGSFIAGPLQFLNFANSIRIPHFSATEHFTDSRLGKIMVYSRTNTVGDTRLNAIERTYKGKILASMEKAGFKPATPVTDTAASKLNFLKDWEIDTSTKGSPFEGMSQEEVRNWAKTNLGDSSTVSEYKGKTYIKTDSFIKQVKTTYELNRVLGKSRLTSAVRTRVLGKFFDFTLHPMHIADQKINSWFVNKTSDAFKKWQSNRETKIGSGASVVETVDSRSAKDATNATKDRPAQAIDGGSTDSIGGSKASQAISSLKDFATSKTGKIGGGALLGVGIICGAREVANGIGDFKLAQVYEPLIRTYMEAVSVAAQIAAGEDVDMTQLNYYAEKMVERDQNGKILNDTSMSKSIKANNGESGGIDLDTNTKEAIKAGAIPTGLQWTVTGTTGSLVSALCGTTGQIIGGVLTIGSIFIGGGILTTLIGAAAFGAGIHYATQWLQGQAVNIDATGAEYGSQADYGGALTGAAQAMQFAGNTLTSTQISELNQQTAEYQQQEFDSQSFIARLFNPVDTHSLTSQMIESNVFDTKNTIASLQEGLLSPLSAIPNFFSNIFSGKKAFAAASTYDYGIPVLGFSLEDQNDPIIAIPQENAQKVGELLDDPNQSSQAQEYIARAKRCYDVNIVKGTDGWDVMPTTAPDAFKSIYIDKGYQDSDCNTSGAQDPNWLRIRAFIADTAVIESWACTEGDDASCAASGVGSAASTGVTTTSSSTIDTSTLTQASDTVACAAGTKDLGTQQGYSSGTPVTIRVCSIPGFKSTAAESAATGQYAISGANGDVIVNSRVSGAWLALFNAAKNDNITLSATSSFRSMAMQQHLRATLGAQAAPGGYSNHQLGLAIDIADAGGVRNIGATTCAQRARAPSSTVWTWMNNNAAKFGFKQFTAESWHWDPMPVSYNCGGDGS